MTRSTLILLAAVIWGASLLISVQPPFAVAQPGQRSQIYNIPPGAQRIIWGTGPVPSLPFVLRIIMGGHPGLKIVRILSSTGTPDFYFGDFSPFEVTVFFVQNPATVESGQYEITLDNTTDTDQRLEISSLVK